MVEFRCQFDLILMLDTLWRLPWAVFFAPRLAVETNYPVRRPSLDAVKAFPFAARPVCHVC